tara:strand:- start:4145 stop:4975 length:831 start_codon:yes stop_codon:yes gene_type:complete
MRNTAGRTRLGWPRLLELTLVALLIVQCVRLLWTAVTPVGPFDEWRGRHAEIMPAEMRTSLFRSFDAFYPAPVAGAPAQNVTSLALTLYGIRVNEGSGQGSAIIAGADGVQGSYAVGDEVTSGVILKAVAFDHVVIDRGGIEESIFLDQSSPVTPVAPASDAEGAPPAVPIAAAALSPAQPDAGGLTVEKLKAGVDFAPRTSNGRITGLVVTSKGPGFAAAGFRGGDVVTQINGRSISSADDLAVLQRALAPGARISLMVERGADVVPIAMTIQGQ